MADLNAIREQVRNELTPLYNEKATTIQSAGDKQVAGYNDYSTSVASRYQNELNSLTAQEADTTKTELGKVEAGAAAAGAQGGVVTANRLMTTSQIGKDYGAKRSATTASNEDTLSRIRQLIATTEADTASKLAGIKTEAAGAIESTASSRYGQLTAAEQAKADEAYRQSQAAEQRRQFNVSQSNSNASRAAAEQEEFAKEQANFNVSVNQVKDLLANPDPKKRISWGDAFWMVKKAAPNATNDDIDAALDKANWSKPGAYNVYASQQKKLKSISSSGSGDITKSFMGGGGYK